MHFDSYRNTEAEDLFEELDKIQSQVKDMFKQFKCLNRELAALELSNQAHVSKHPLKQLYIHGRMDTDDLSLRISEAKYHCISIASFVNYIEDNITDPEMRVFDEAYQYIKQNGDNGTFNDMLRLYHEVINSYKQTRKFLERLNNTAVARMESI
jgi:hypothetical protein